MEKRKHAGIPEPQTLRALLVKENWGDAILTGSKTWELRTTDTKIRGRVFIAYSGTGMIFGSVELSDTIPVDVETLLMNTDKHKLDHEQIADWNIKPTSHAWVMTDSIKFEKPIPYDHPQGAVIWVTLPDTYNEWL